MKRSWKVVLWSFFALCVCLTAEAFLPAASQPSARLSVGLLHAYQSVGSPAMAACGVQCRYRPSCSHYAVDAISYYGTLDGLARTAGRLWRCSPWGGCGYDPAVEEHSAAFVAPQETPEERAAREKAEAEQIRRVEENLKKAPDKAAMDEVNRALREGLRNANKNQAAAPQNETDDQRRKREEEEAKQAAKAIGAACAGGTLWCGFVVVMGLVYLTVKIIIMVWAFKDAKARGDQNAVLWPVLIFFLTPVIGLVIYLVARPKGEFSPCGSCHQKRLTTLVKCPHCSADAGAPAKPT
jgi:putative membrane protein insertion efficiency factor